jgi:hypothetical protein
VIVRYTAVPCGLTCPRNVERWLSRAFGGDRRDGLLRPRQFAEAHEHSGSDPYSGFNGRRYRCRARHIRRAAIVDWPSTRDPSGKVERTGKPAVSVSTRVSHAGS